MVIESIFGEQLYSFKYEGAIKNEYFRLFELWDDAEYIHSFLKENEGDIPKRWTIDTFSEHLLNEAFDLEEDIIQLSDDENPRLSQFFKPLYNQEYHITELSRQKGKQKYLRIYAIRIDENCFVITGGTIKLTHLMQDRPHSNEELSKINQCRDFLKENGVFDNDSFHEMISEQ